MARTALRKIVFLDVRLARYSKVGPVASSTCRSFSVLQRPPPSYPGHVPLNVPERFGLAIGSAIGSLLNPYRHGERQS